MMRHPPAYVPSAMAVAALKTTHIGGITPTGSAPQLHRNDAPGGNAHRLTPVGSPNNVSPDPLDPVKHWGNRPTGNRR